MQIVNSFSLITNIDAIELLIGGSCLQILLTLFLPTTMSVLPVTVVLAALWLRRLVQNQKPPSTQSPTRSKALQGRYRAQLPREAGVLSTAKSEAEVVVFIVGVYNSQYAIHWTRAARLNPFSILTQTNSPDGRSAPGFKEVTQYFQSIWAHAEAEREKWGCACPLPEAQCSVLISIFQSCNLS